MVDARVLAKPEQIIELVAATQEGPPMTPAEHTPPNGSGDTHSEHTAAKSAAYEQGLRIRRSVMGDDFVSRALARAAGTQSEMIQDFVTEHVWGAQWSRPALDRRSRSLLTIGILVALRAHEELSGHVSAAITNGLTPAEITEAIVHSVGYCGAPAALSAMRVVQASFDADNPD